jgi:PLP dependent protein
MHDVLNKLLLINNEIQKKNSKVKIIAVTKTFPLNTVLPLINHGHIDYGENKVQEALEKWSSLKEDFPKIKLHMIGKLQTNKVKYALPLFDYIHSLDSFKLAQKIHNEQKKINKKIKIFIQVNIGNEDQKSGISPENLEEFYKKCSDELELKIIGLMCIPPNDRNSDLYFSKMNKLLNAIGLKELSMGMSNDYLKAVEHNSSFIRIGSKIFGNRG